MTRSLFIAMTGKDVIYTTIDILYRFAL